MQGIIEIQMDKYLCQFMRGLLRAKGEIVELKREHWFSNVIYDSMAVVPEDCVFQPREIPDKGKLKLGIETIGGRNAPRKYAVYHYYLPHSKQVLIERYVRDYMGNLLCVVIGLGEDKTSEEIKNLIDRFCQVYGIDFGRFYETLKKKYYRFRRQYDFPLFSTQLSPE